jgi:hypothetical protein
LRVEIDGENRTAGVLAKVRLERAAERQVRRAVNIVGVKLRLGFGSE